MSEEIPPALKEADDYEQWRIVLQQWRCSTNMEPKRQALAVRSKLTGKAREIALGLDAADLNKEAGMDFLLDKLDSSFRKEKKNKWDVPSNGGRDSQNNHLSTPTTNGTGQPHATLTNGASTPSLTAAERARQRAAELSAKLAKEGKYQTKPMSLLPTAISNPVDQFKIKNANPVTSDVTANILRSTPSISTPEVMKKDTGGYFAKFDINDLQARHFLTKPSTHELILEKTGCGASLRGRYMSADEKRKQILSGLKDAPLTLFLEADISAKVQVAVHKIADVCRNYAKNPDNSISNYGLSGNTSQQSTHHFIQDKVFVGMERMNPRFDVKWKLLGTDGANFKFITQQTGAKIFLRGKGSGYLEQNSGRESFEALHIYMSHARQDGLISAKELCTNLIETVRNQYKEWETSQDGTNRGPQQRYDLMSNARNPNNSDMSYRAAAPPQELYQQQRPCFEQFHRPPYSANVQRPNFGYPPRMEMAPLQYPQFRPQMPPMQQGAIGNFEDQFTRPDQERIKNRDREERQIPRDGSPRRESSRDRTERDYSPRNRGHRDRSPGDKSPRDRSPRDREPRDRGLKDQSPRDLRRSKDNDSPARSPSRHSSSHRSSSPISRGSSRNSPESTNARSKRRFTEAAPKKRRKFSEDPKLVEQSRKRLEEDSTVKSTAVGTMSPEPSQSKSRENFPMKKVMPPPSLGSPSNALRKKDEAIFQMPAPISKKKPSSPRALRMGALGSLAEYADDSDDD